MLSSRHESEVFKSALYIMVKTITWIRKKHSLTKINNKTTCIWQGIYWIFISFSSYMLSVVKARMVNWWPRNPIYHITQLASDHRQSPKQIPLKVEEALSAPKTGPFYNAICAKAISHIPINVYSLRRLQDINFKCFDQKTTKIWILVHIPNQLMGLRYILIYYNLPFGQYMS